ncbi:MAG: NAD-binding protein [Firmicutes bacterium]|nr:NAD-binding protein [Bacillota bacterium]
MKSNGSKSKEYVVIVGCGRLGAMIANELSDKSVDVLIIDRDKNAFRKLSPSFGGLSMTGDGADYKVLKEANIEHATSVIMVTNNDNVNILISQMLREKGINGEIIIRLYDPERRAVFDTADVDIISPLLLSFDMIKQKMNEAIK